MIIFSILLHEGEGGRRPDEGKTNLSIGNTAPSP